jgi:cytochrome c5
MKRRTLLWALAAGLAPFAAALVMAGCGGSGGPLTRPPGEDPPGPSAAFLALLPAAQKTATYVGGAPCITCHETGVGGAPVVDFAKWSATKHAQVGLGCEQCHGPASVHVAAPSDQNILTQPNVTRSVVCAQCHGPMAAEYNASPHAEAVEEVLEDMQAATNTSTGRCLRCHSAQLRTKMIEAPLTAGKSAADIDAALTALTLDQLKAHAAATHETATCVNCHSPMQETGKPMVSGKLALLRHRTHNTDTSVVGTPGAALKDTQVFDHQCGACHLAGTSTTPKTDDASLNAGTARVNFHYNPQYYMLSGTGGVEITPPVVRNSSHFSQAEQCVKCHMPGSKHTMTVSFDLSCSPCHTAADAAARYAIRGNTELQLYALRTRMEAWARGTTFTGPDITNDPDMWMYTTYITELGKTAPNQAQVPIELKRARHNYYLILRDGSFGIHNAPYTRHLLNAASQQLTALGRAATPATRAPSAAERARIRAILQQDIAMARRADTKDLLKQD